MSTCECLLENIEIANEGTFIQLEVDFTIMLKKLNYRVVKYLKYTQNISIRDD